MSDALEVGYDVPALPGMAEAEVQTPCLILDLEPFERNVSRMHEICGGLGVRHRAHGKMHRSADIARYQIEAGGACGICCQKVSEAEAFQRAGLADILITNQVTEPAKIDRLARLAGRGRIIVCADDPGNVIALSEAAQRHGTQIEVLVEIECGAERCGVAPGAPAVALARAIDGAPGLRFSGIQAYHGAAQHKRPFSERQALIEAAITDVRATVDLLSTTGLACDIIGGAGTGTYMFEGASGLYNELQCGSYAFMDADYAQILDQAGEPVSEFEHALFVLTSVMSTAVTGQAVCDAGLKAHSVDSGPPVIFGRPDLGIGKFSDEHGVIADPENTLKLNDRLRLVPGHCDPTCNLHDWYVGVRNGVVETLWPVTARGKGF